MKLTIERGLEIAAYSLFILIILSLPLLTEVSSFAATSKFSRVVKSLKTLGIWNFRPTPDRAILCSDRLVIFLSNKWTVPDVAFVLPLIKSINVVLPAPFGPRLILLDEPTAGMTRDETYKTATIIKPFLTNFRPPRRLRLGSHPPLPRHP